MKKFLILTCLLAGACASDKERFAARCQGYGFQPGTDAFAQCMMEEEHRAWDAVGRSVDRMNQNRPMQANCNTIGGYTSCTAY